MQQLDLFGNPIETGLEVERPRIVVESFTNREYKLEAVQKEGANTGVVKVQAFNLHKPFIETVEQPQVVNRQSLLQSSPLQVPPYRNQDSLSNTTNINRYSMDTPTEDKVTVAEDRNWQTPDETAFKQTGRETQRPQPFSEIETGFKFVETEEDNDESSGVEETADQILEVQGADEVVAVERVQSSKDRVEEKMLGKLDDAEIFNDGKIRVKIKQKVPEVAVIEEEEKKEEQQSLLQKRGRKSFKEIDAEVDLIEIPEDEVLFERQYYSISQVAEWFKVNTSLIRFWENEFDILKPKKNRKGDRLFRPEDVKNLQLIYHLLRQRKYTIEGAKEFIRTNKKKADMQLQLATTLQKFRGFLLDLKANLQ